MARKSVAHTGAHPVVKFHTVELNGDLFRLAFDFNAIATAESIAGVNLLQVLDLQGMSALQYRAMFYAALIKAHPDMTLANAGALVTLATMGRITDAMMEAWRASIGLEDEPANPPLPEEKSSAG